MRVAVRRSRPRPARLAIPQLLRFSRTRRFSIDPLVRSIIVFHHSMTSKHSNQRSCLQQFFRLGHPENYLLSLSIFLIYWIKVFKKMFDLILKKASLTRTRIKLHHVASLCPIRSWSEPVLLFSKVNHIFPG